MNTAPRERLLRVPGLGTRSVGKLITSRRSGRLRLDDIARLTKGIGRARDFLVAADWNPKALDDAKLKSRLVKQPAQMSLF